MKFKIALAAAAASLAFAAPANAAQYLFTMTGGYEASWQMDSNATPDSYFGWMAKFSNVTGTFQGLTGSSVTIDFYGNLPGWDGLTISDNGTGSVLADAFGHMLFSGPNSAPTFLLGTYDLTNNLSWPNANPVQLVISEVPGGAVPEPATWALMILGFGAVGFAMRRRQQVATTVRYA